MPPFRKPTFAFDYDIDDELGALRGYSSLAGRGDRAIPKKTQGRLLLATWNIANLGVQQRREKDYRLIAEIISWFDPVAVQEVNANLSGLRGIQAQLPDRYGVMFNDAGGNNERFAFVFDTTKVAPLEEAGEVTVAAADLPRVKVPGITGRFVGFDRNPMLATFAAGGLRFALANVHLYFGEDREDGRPDDEAHAASQNPAAAAAGGEAAPAAGMDRRVLEARAVAMWGRQRAKSGYVTDAVALGDFNLPRQAPGDRVYDALTRQGLQLPAHSTKVDGSNLNDDAAYDQMAIVPGALADAIEQLGIFDFDGALFRQLWAAGSEKDQVRFRAYMRYYLSDHRPLWMSLAV